MLAVIEHAGLSHRLVLLFAIVVHDFIDKLVFIDHLNQRVTRLQLLFHREPLFRIVALAISEASEALKHPHLRVRSKLNCALNALVSDRDLVTHVNSLLSGGLRIGA